MSAALELTKSRSSAGRYFFCAWENVVFSIWLSSADAEAMNEMVRFSQEVTRSWSNYSSVHIIEEGAGIPTKDGREKLVEGARASGSRVACAAALLPESSVMATLMRAFVRGVRTLTRGMIDIGIEQQADALAQWLAPRHTERTGVAVSQFQLVQLIRDARKRASRFRE